MFHHHFKRYLSLELQFQRQKFEGRSVDKNQANRNGKKFQIL